MRQVVLLGSTGSIGKNTIKVVRELSDRLKIVGLAANKNVDLIWEQIQEVQPEVICLYEAAAAKYVREKLKGKIPVLEGLEGLIQIAQWPTADIVVIAIVGTCGLKPALAALEAGKDIAIASKEILVMAGHIVMSYASKYRKRVLAVDSEHSAIFQCIDGKDPKTIRRVWLTASGGPFRTFPKEKLKDVTLEQALNHPSWVMGRKITIDSATLFNKGLEMIEARWLFNIEIDRIKVIIHPQSVIHSMVEFVDGSFLAQLSYPDMTIPIQYALTYPERIPSERVKTDFVKIGTLSFEEPDEDKFPALRLARIAGTIGGTMPAVLNAANEVAVEAFCNREIVFIDIPYVVEKVMEIHQPTKDPSLEEILNADTWARTIAKQLIQQLYIKNI